MSTRKPTTKKRPPTKPARLNIQLTDPESTRGLEPFNIIHNDTLTLELVLDDSALAEDELLMFCTKATKQWAGIGRYFRSENEAFNTEYYCAGYATGGGGSFEKSKYVAFRVLNFTRSLKPDQPERETSSDEERQQRLDGLRARLERLEESDDTTDCSARFRLEKEIYDLEHEPEDDSILNADWIGEGGA